MDSFELNKIIAAVLMVALLVIGIGKISNIMFHVEKPEKPGFVVEVAKTDDTINIQKEEVEAKVDISLIMAQGDVGSGEQYKYSNALVEYGKEWNFEELNGFLEKPTAYIKGTKMAFAGLRKEEERASVIKYLNQNSDSPVPLP